MDRPDTLVFLHQGFDRGAGILLAGRHGIYGRVCRWPENKTLLQIHGYVAISVSDGVDSFLMDERAIVDVYLVGIDCFCTLADEALDMDKRVALEQVCNG